MRNSNSGMPFQALLWRKLHISCLRTSIVSSTITTLLYFHTTCNNYRLITPFPTVAVAAPVWNVEYRPPPTLVALLTQRLHKTVFPHCLFCLLVPPLQPLNPHPDPFRLMSPQRCAPLLPVKGFGPVCIGIT